MDVNWVSTSCKIETETIAGSDHICKYAAPKFGKV